MRTLTIALTTVGLLVASAIGAGGQEDPTSRPPVPSAGCGASKVEPGSLSGSVVVDGVERTWTMRVPDAHDGHVPRPLWIQLHGLGEGAISAVRKVADVADEHGFIAAPPRAPSAMPPGPGGPTIPSST